MKYRICETVYTSHSTSSPLTRSGYTVAPPRGFRSSAPVLGSKLVVSDNYQQPDDDAGRDYPLVDLDEVDPASSGAAVNIATGVVPTYAVSADLTQIAYEVLSGPVPGIYVSPVP